MARRCQAFGGSFILIHFLLGYHLAIVGRREAGTSDSTS